MSSPSHRVNALQFTALGPPHLQGPTIGPFSSRLLLRGWGSGVRPELVGRVTSWAASAQPWKSPGSGWLLGARLHPSSLPGSLGCWALVPGGCLGQRMVRGSSLQYPASQPCHSGVWGACVQETQATAGIYPLSHSSGVYVRGRGAPGMY